MDDVILLKRSVMFYGLKLLTKIYKNFIYFVSDFFEVLVLI